MSLDRQRIDAVKLLQEQGYAWNPAEGWHKGGIAGRVAQALEGKRMVWTLTISSDSREAPCPELFATEAEAMAAFENYMRESWAAYTPADKDDKPLPYPGATEALRWFESQYDIDFPFAEVLSHLV